MRVTCWVCVLAVAANALPAQELGVFVASSRPGPWSDVAVGGGVSAAAFMRLGSVFAETHRFSRSDLQVGFRIGLSESHASQYTTWWCGSECGPQEPRTMRTRLRTTQYSLMILPYRSRSTRVEVGGGVASHAFRGDLRATIPGVLATAGLARRLARGLPIWASVGYEYHNVLREFWQVWPQDGSSAATPTHALRLGVVLRR
jgi:hypothetical protein